MKVTESATGQIAIVMENTQDISKMLLALSYSERRDLIPQRVVEALEEGMGE